MQLYQETRNIVTSGVQATKQFGIKLGAHIMHVLSGLYSDVPWAIVREYGTNMFDAYQKMPPGAVRRPPVIQAPNIMSPFIEFKDYGRGMDKDEVMNVFTQYGESTKRDSN